jgi:hypothetical protein
MKVKHCEEITKNEIVVDQIVCNKCGKSFKPKYMGVGHYEHSQIHSFDVRFGYNSEFPDEYWGFDLCNTCVIELANSFVKPVDKSISIMF